MLLPTLLACLIDRKRCQADMACVNSKAWISNARPSQTTRKMKQYNRKHHCRSIAIKSKTSSDFYKEAQLSQLHLDNAKMPCHTGTSWNVKSIEIFMIHGILTPLDKSVPFCFHAGHCILQLHADLFGFEIVAMRHDHAATTENSRAVPQPKVKRKGMMRNRAFASPLLLGGGLEYQSRPLFGGLEWFHLRSTVDFLWPC